MENFKEKIGGYIEINKKNSKLNKTEVSDVGVILKAGLAEGDIIIDDAIDILLELHYAVTSEFIKSVFTDLSDEVKADFISKFLRAEKIVKNVSNYGITRCLVIINSLLQMGSNDEYIHMLLKVSAKRAYGKDGGQKAGELLTKICLDDTRSKLFLLDYSAWDETELRNLSAWLNNAINYTQNQEIIGGYLKFIEKYNLPTIKRVDTEVSSFTKAEVKEKGNPQKESDEKPNNVLGEHVPTKTPKIVDADNQIQKKGIREKINSIFTQLLSEADKVDNEKIKLTDELAEIKSKLEKVTKENESLLAQLSETNSRNSQLQEQIRIKQIIIQDSEKKMTEMNERLEYAYKADKRAGNQEIISLKNELAKQLKLDYEAFQKLSVKEPAQYHLYYEGLVGIIESIFDSLRRKGIVINSENEV